MPHKTGYLHVRPSQTRAKMNSASSRIRTRQSTSSSKTPGAGDRLERIKSIAAIFSSIAVPIVLTVAGYFIQKQLSSEGIRKDYVGIATAILKERPEGQEPDLRAWAVKILDENSPVPFSKKAKEGLITGSVVVSGLPWMGPPEDCMKPPAKRSIDRKFNALAKNSRTSEVNDYMKQLVDFANQVSESEDEVAVTAARLRCMQSWATIMEKADADFRVGIGAPSSKEQLEQLRKYNLQSASQASSTPK